MPWTLQSKVSCTNLRSAQLLPTLQAQAQANGGFATQGVPFGSGVNQDNGGGPTQGEIHPKTIWFWSQPRQWRWPNLRWNA